MSHPRWTGLALLVIWPILVLAQPVPAPSVTATDTYHGVLVNDPYRNLEDLKNPQTQQWLHAQGEFAAAQLARIEGRDALRDRIAELSATTGDVVVGITRRAGGRVFYLKRGAGESQFKLVLRQRPGGAERVLVDPQALARAKGVPHAINYFTPSWDGRTLAYGVSAGGSEDASLYVMDVDSGRQLREPIPRVHLGGVSWSPDGRWLGFNQLRQLPNGAAESETYFDSTVFVLDRRRPRAAPRAVFGRHTNPGLGLDRLDVGQLIFAPDSSYVLARTTDTTVPEGRLFIAPVAGLRSGKIAWLPWTRPTRASNGPSPSFPSRSAACCKASCSADEPSTWNCRRASGSASCDTTRPTQVLESTWHRDKAGALSRSRAGIRTATNSGSPPVHGQPLRASTPSRQTAAFATPACATTVCRPARRRSR
jgi:hypothetical protein